MEDFCGLLTPPPPDSPEQAQHTEYIKQDNDQKEQSWTNDCHNAELNKPFTIEETRKIMTRAKSGKVPGVDGLVVDILKNEASIRLLSELFNACMENSMIPMVWSLGMISPIPKSSSNDPRVPLNYHGISLLSVPGKLYTAAISYRLSNYLKKNKKLADEQKRI